MKLFISIGVALIGLLLLKNVLDISSQAYYSIPKRFITLKIHE